jgi:hypothetical protein
MTVRREIAESLSEVHGAKDISAMLLGAEYG